MTDSLIPYSFVPGTKAKAQEVNANFIALAQGITETNNTVSDNFNTLDSKIDSSVENLYSDCADTHLKNTNAITNVILEAPNGVASYTDSTLTVKSGLKVLIPDGKNSDGTLKNIELTLDEDVAVTRSISNSGKVYFTLDYQKNAVDYKNYVIVDNYDNITENTTLYYCISDNKMYYKDPQNIVSQVKVIVLGYFNNGSASVSGAITSLTPNKIFTVITRNNICELSKIGFPSNRTISLTVGASGTQYVAPANGYFMFYAWSNSTSLSYANIANVTIYQGNYPLSSYRYTNIKGPQHTMSVPARKGDTVALDYNMGGSKILYFIYADGEEV